MNDRRAFALIYLALVLSLGHHLDHAVRGNHVGWPLTAEARRSPRASASTRSSW